MTKKKFLAALSTALRRLIPKERDKYLSYYDEAISDLMENGVSESVACQRQGDVKEIADAILQEADRTMLRKRDIIGILLSVLTIIFSAILVFCLLVLPDSGVISLVLADGPTSLFFAGKIEMPIVLLIMGAVLIVSCALYAVIKKHVLGIVIGLTAFVCVGSSVILYMVSDKTNADRQELLTEQELMYGQLENQEEIEQRTETVISLISEGDYDTLSASYAGEEMKPYLNAENMEPAKNMLSEDWGAYQFMGNVYAQALKQNGVRYIVVQVTVTYENVSVVYTINYNEDLMVVGIYMR